MNPDTLSQDILEITADSRRAHGRVIFVAVRGTNVDGHQFLGDVVARGARVLVVEDAGLVPKGFDGAVLNVKNSRRAFSILSAAFFEFPSKEISVLGVTGTNGKTTTSYLLEQVFNFVGLPLGVMGTINHHLGSQVWETELTTSDPFAVHQRLRDFVNAGAKASAMESSSHALDQMRVDDVDYQGVLFTNLTLDHLDYHGTMEKYFEAKQLLFSKLLKRSSQKNKFAVVNRDDVWAVKLQVDSSAKILSFGQALLKPSSVQIGSRVSEDFSFTVLEQGFFGQRVRMECPLGTFEMNLKIAGLFNAYNATSVFATALALGISPQMALEALADFRGVPGRLERCGLGTDRFVFVDYAHTDDALKNTLKCLVEIRDQSKEKKPAQIWTVFGCGGDRDRSKRPKMAKVAEEFSDHIIVTSDNPRTENPTSILEEIKNGFSARQVGSVHFELDRKKAIESALEQSLPGDVILIAGKGHETYQILGTQKIHFDDREVVDRFKRSSV